MTAATQIHVTPFIDMGDAAPTAEARRYRLRARPAGIPAGAGRLVITVSQTLRWHDQSQGIMASYEQDLDFTGELHFEDDADQFFARFRDGRLMSIRRLS